MSGQTDWIAQTRFLPPGSHPDVIARPRLLALLDERVSASRLTLVSAPAGYGKTTLLSAWAQRAREGREETVGGSFRVQQAAWLSLDEEDNDPARFLTALVGALQRLNPAFGAATHTAILIGSLPAPGQVDPVAAVRRVAGALVNDVLTLLPGHFALVLDDLHLVNNPLVYFALEYLVERLPAGLRLVVATRRDPPLPLARWRVRGQLGEMRLADLRFTAVEAGQFINCCLALDLPAADLEALYSRTEGWAAGLRLLAISLVQLPTARHAAFFGRLAQANRYIFDYLADEVLESSDPHLRTFLLETSILTELTPQLCSAVTGFSDAPGLLDEIYRRNLFVVALETGLPEPAARAFHPAGLRYHALFAEFLRQKLVQQAPGRLLELHARAAQAQARPERAIPHYLAAGMWATAAQAISQAGWELLREGLFTSLDGWVRALPAPVLAEYPQLEMLLYHCALQQGDLEGAQDHAARAASCFAASGLPGWLGGALTGQAALALVRGDLPQAGELCAQALPLPLLPATRVVLLVVRAWVYYYERQQAQLQAALDEALQLANQLEDLQAYFPLVAFSSVRFLFLPGPLPGYEALCRRLADTTSGGSGPLQAALLELQAAFHFWRGQFALAGQAAQAVLAIKEQLGSYPTIGPDAATLLVVMAMTQANLAQAASFWEQLDAQVDRQALTSALLVEVLYLKGRLHWQAGELAGLRACCESLQAPAGGLEIPEAPLLRLVLRALLEIAERRLAAAEQTLRQAAILDTPVLPVHLRASAGLLLAWVLLQRGRPADALAAFAPLLAQCQADGAAGPVVKEGRPAAALLRLAIEHNCLPAYAAQLLEMMAESPLSGPQAVPGSSEVLTGREMEVLRLLAQGSSNRAIAAALFISPPTVKTHVAHILQKLNAASRTQAVAHARQLHLL